MEVPALAHRHGGLRMTGQRRRYLIPTWALWAVAIGAFLALVLVPGPVL